MSRQQMTTAGKETVLISDAPRHPGNRDRRLVAWFITALTLLSFVLFASRGGEVGYWYDELWSVDAVSGSLRQMLARVSADVHPPGYHAVLWVWVRLFGTSEGATHALSALFVSATVPFVYALGRNLALSLPASLGAAAFTGFGYASINYALETRPYGLLLLMTTATSWAVSAPFTMRRFALAVFFSTAGLYSHHAFLFTAIPAVFLLAFRQAQWRWALLLVAWLFVLSPYLSLVATHSARFKQLGFLAEPTLAAALKLHQFFIGNPLGTWLFAFVAAGCAARAILRKRFREDAWLLIFPAAFWGLFAVSYILQPLFHQRYLLPLTPWTGLTIFFLIDQLPRRSVSASSVLITLIALGSAQYFFVKKGEDWRAPSRYVLDNRGGAAIITTETSPFFRHYIHDIEVFSNRDLSDVSSWLSRNAGRQAWLLQARSYKATPTTRAIAESTDILEIHDFPGARALKLKVNPSLRD